MLPQPAKSQGANWFFGKAPLDFKSSTMLKLGPIERSLNLCSQLCDRPNQSTAKMSEEDMQH